MSNDEPAEPRGRAIGALTVFTGLLALLIFVVATLSDLGVPETMLVWLVAGFGVIVPAGVAISARTISLTEFATAGRNVGLGENAMAIAVAAFGGVFAMALAGAVLRDEREMTTLLLGLCGGMLVGGALIVPYFRKCGSATLGELLSARFNSRVVCGVAGLIVASALLPMLVAQLSVAGMIASWTLGISRQAAVVAAAVLIVLAPLLGGMRGLTLSGLVQFLFVFVALVGTTIWIAASVTVSPLIAGAGVEAHAVQAISAAETLAAWRHAGLTLSIALGVASFPPLLLRAASGRSSGSVRSSLAWALLFVAVFSACALTLAGFAKLALTGSTHNGEATEALVDAGAWIAHWAELDPSLVTICGKPVADGAAIAAACGTDLPGLGDVAIDPDIALLAAPAMAGMPPLASMVVATACLVAALAAASLTLFAIGTALGHDLYVRAIAPRAPVSGQLLMQRLVLLLAGGLAAYVAFAPPAGYLQLALWSLSLTASGLFPVLMLAVWWNRANWLGALAALVAGFAVAACLIAATAYQPLLFSYLEPLYGLADFARWLGGDLAPIAAIPIALLLAILVSMVTRAPDAARRAFADALAAPRDIPLDGRQ